MPAQLAIKLKDVGALIRLFADQFGTVPPGTFSEIRDGMVSNYSCMSGFGTVAMDNPQTFVPVSKSEVDGFVDLRLGSLPVLTAMGNIDRMRFVHQLNAHRIATL